VGTILQAIYTIAFLLPSIYLLVKKKEHLDFYSKVMLIIYQTGMALKLAFYITEMFVEERTFYIPSPLKL